MAATVNEQLHPAIQRFLSSGNPCIFVGAGISNNPPTSIPLFPGIRDAYLEAIDPGNTILRTHAGIDFERVQSDIRGIPIERFFSDLVTSIGSVVYKPFSWMNRRPPNSCHHFLGHIVERYKVQTVLTTNFDRLLETAIPGAHVLASMKAGYRQQSSSGYAGSQEEVVHGRLSDGPAIVCLHDQAGADGLDVTTAATAMPFDHIDYGSLAARLRGASVLVLGYGGGDLVDIAPFLTTMDIEQLLWVSHAETREAVERTAPAEWRTRITPESFGLDCNTEWLLGLMAGVPSEPEEGQPSASFEDEVASCLAEVLTQPTRHYLLSCFANAVNRGRIGLSLLDASPRYSLERSGFAGLIARRARSISMSRSSEPALREAARVLLTREIEKIPGLMLLARAQDEGTELQETASRECGLTLESLAIMHWEAGDVADAIGLCERAEEYFTDPEDLFRIDLHKHLFLQEMPLSEIVGERDARRVRRYQQRASSSPVRSGDPKAARFLRKMADRALSKGSNAKQALNLSELALYYDPKSVEAYVDVSSLRNLKGDFAGALAALESGLEKIGEHYKLLCNKGYCLNLAGRQREAESVLLRALDLNNQDALAWNNLGKARLELGKLDKAKKAYINAVILDPTLEAARNNLENLEVHLSRLSPGPLEDSGRQGVTDLTEDTRNA